MIEIQFSIELIASKERVWATLWEDLTFRDWASIIDEGTYMKGVMHYDINCKNRCATRTRINI